MSTKDVLSRSACSAAMQYPHSKSQHYTTEALTVCNVTTYKLSTLVVLESIDLEECYLRSVLTDGSS